MVKLQKIDRANGTSVYSMNIPKEVIQTYKWHKGDNLTVELKGYNGKQIIIVYVD